MPAIDKEQAKWAAESDARTLAEVKVVRGDSTGLKKAKEAAKKKAKEETIRIDALRKIAGLKPIEKK